MTNIKKPVKNVLNELFAFQKILDGEVLDNESLQEWCGHINYILGNLIKEININFNLLKDAELLAVELKVPIMSTEVEGYYT